MVPPSWPVVLSLQCLQSRHWAPPGRPEPSLVRGPLARQLGTRLPSPAGCPHTLSPERCFGSAGGFHPFPSYLGWRTPVRLGTSPPPSGDESWMHAHELEARGPFPPSCGWAPRLPACPTALAAALSPSGDLTILLSEGSRHPASGLGARGGGGRAGRRPFPLGLEQGRAPRAFGLQALGFPDLAQHRSGVMLGGPRGGGPRQPSAWGEPAPGRMDAVCQGPHPFT